MGRATDAGVVVAHQVLSAAGGFGVVEGEHAGDEGTEVVFDLPLVLRSGGHDLGLGNQAVVADPVAVVDQPAGRLGGVAAFAGLWSIGHAADGRLENLTQGRVFACEPIPPHLLAMIADGGLLPHLAKKLKARA